MQRGDYQLTTAVTQLGLVASRSLVQATDIRQWCQLDKGVSIQKLLMWRLRHAATRWTSVAAFSATTPACREAVLHRSDKR